MKLFTFLFSIYLLFLTCMPCGDVAGEENRLGKQTAIEKEMDHHNHTTKACTPFCCCSCCSTSVIFQAFILIDIYKPTFQSVNGDYCAFYISKDFHSIWQPPRTC